jgi:uncharacterized protein YegL
MSGDKINTLNTAVKDTIPFMVDVASENPNAQIYVRVLSFGTHATWGTPSAVKLEDFTWDDLDATYGGTNLGKAFRELATQMRMPPMPERQLPPVVVLLSDGQPTDDYKTGLQELMAEPWAQRAVRLSIAIGRDADREVLQQFIGHPELKPLEANDPEALTQSIRWASTQAIKSASSGASSGDAVAVPGGNVPLPQPPSSTGGAKVW